MAKLKHPGRRAFLTPEKQTDNSRAALWSKYDL